MKWLLTAWLLWLLAPIPVQAQQAEAYRLLPQDRIQVRAMRWDIGLSRFVVWEGLSGEYGIATDGTLALPLVGSVNAVGETVGTLADRLSTRLQLEVGLPEPPRIAIETIGHAPIYVLGAVTTPGAYSFRPGLTAQQALALAGGVLRSPTELAGENAPEIMRLGGEMRSLMEQISVQESARNRVLKDLESLSAATTATSAAPVPEPTGRAADILVATQAARSAQQDRIADLKQVLTEQIGKIEEQIALRDEQIALVQSDLDDVNSLRDRGLAVNDRVAGLISMLSNLQAQRIQLDITRLTAEQDLNRTQRDELALNDDARSDNLRQLDEIESVIAALEINLDTVRSLLDQTLSTSVTAGQSLPGAAAAVNYRIIRGSEVLDALPDRRLVPGDTLEIARGHIATASD